MFRHILSFPIVKNVFHYWNTLYFEKMIFQSARCFWRIFDNRKIYCAVKILMDFNAIWNIPYWMHNTTFKTCFSTWRYPGKNWAYPGILAILGLFFILYNGKLHCFNFVAGIWNFFQIFFFIIAQCFFAVSMGSETKRFFRPTLIYIYIYSKN